MSENSANVDTRHSSTSNYTIHKMVVKILDYLILILISAVVIYPILLILINSFKSKSYISSDPFSFPTAENFVGWENYTNGLQKSSFWPTLWHSIYVTVISVVLILIFASMTAWYLTRVKTWWSKVIYYGIIFSMIVPFQTVMLTLPYLVDKLNMSSYYYLPIVYVGFGAGLSIFIYSGFVKGIPTDIEEAAVVDGCNTLQVFFYIVLPLLKPVTITVAVLDTMWIWNDYLLPYLILGSSPGNGTLPIAIQLENQGGYGNNDMGALMAMIIICLIPVIIFYLFGQKYIIKGVTAGAVKG
jgi:raffinose/stachyose/melibiose transport system permease protein